MINQVEQEKIIEQLQDLGIESYFHKGILWVVNKSDLFIVDQVLSKDECIHYKHIEEEYV